jgi:hypothetical protein
MFTALQSQEVIGQAFYSFMEARGSPVTAASYDIMGFS